MRALVRVMRGLLLRRFEDYVMDDDDAYAYIDSRDLHIGPLLPTGVPPCDTLGGSLDIYLACLSAKAF